MPNLFRKWWLAARPRTWIASIAPVAIGGVMAASTSPFSLPLFGLTLSFALLIQIGTNFANDYFDFLQAADTSERIGPPRAVQQGWISPQAMRNAFIATFALALFFAIPLMVRSGLWWSLPLALGAIACGIFYTAGHHSLGYLGLGEPLVFLFFGPVAVLSTYFLQTLSFSPAALLASFAPALLSSSILIANNLRDETTDRKAHKKTLVVRFGTRFGQWEYASSLLLASIIPPLLVVIYKAPPAILSSAAILPLSYFPLKLLLQDSVSRTRYAPLLPMSAALFTLYTLLFCISWWMGT